MKQAADLRKKQPHPARMQSGRWRAHAHRGRCGQSEGEALPAEVQREAARHAHDALPYLDTNKPVQEAADGAPGCAGFEQHGDGRFAHDVTLVDMRSARLARQGDAALPIVEEWGRWHQARAHQVRRPAKTAMPAAHSACVRHWLQLTPSNGAKKHLRTLGIGCLWSAANKFLPGPSSCDMAAGEHSQRKGKGS